MDMAISDFVSLFGDCFQSVSIKISRTFSYRSIYKNINQISY